MNIVYFDNAATTRIKSEVLNEMMPYLTLNYGNASSLYSIGRISKHAIENPFIMFIYYMMNKSKKLKQTQVCKLAYF